LISTTYFVPYCRFPTPEPGHVDMLTSFPFSRFVKGQKSFILAFGVKGAEGDEWAFLYENVSIACMWRGDKLRVNNNSACVPMLKHKALDLRAFYGRFRPRPGAQSDTFLFVTKRSYLTVTVDYTQNGTSPEVEECNSKFHTECNFPQSTGEHKNIEPTVIRLVSCSIANSVGNDRHHLISLQIAKLINPKLQRN
uniref:DUF5727 domain-containing protein n=1 Tax=Taenia asiatica TaxID=60517 RepID=A0A0R3VZ91_TAEAS